MTVAELITELEKHDPALPVGILYDTQMGFYPAHEVKVEGHGLRLLQEYVCICDSA